MNVTDVIPRRSYHATITMTSCAGLYFTVPFRTSQDAGHPSNTARHLTPCCRPLSYKAVTLPMVHGTARKSGCNIPYSLDCTVTAVQLRLTKTDKSATWRKIPCLAMILRRPARYLGHADMPRLPIALRHTTHATPRVTHRHRD